VGPESALRDSLLFGATAFELSFLSVDELEAFDTSALPAWADSLAPLAFRGLHAPVKGIERWDADTSRRWLPKLRDICKALAIDSLVFHVEQLVDPEMPWFAGLPVSVENADRKNARKLPGGRELEPLRRVLWAGHRVTFDLEHAAERGEKLVYAQTLWNRLHHVREDAVDHFHLSGPTAAGLSHGLTVDSPLATKLMGFLRDRTGIPVILEGRLEAGAPGECELEDQILREMTLLGTGMVNLGEPALAAFTPELKTMVVEAINGLPRDERKVVILRAYEDMTFDEIAKALAQPLVVVCRWYAKGLEHLREKLVDQGGV
jgi:hypothetical protein